MEAKHNNTEEQRPGRLRLDSAVGHLDPHGPAPGVLLLRQGVEAAYKAYTPWVTDEGCPLAMAWVRTDGKPEMHFCLGSDNIPDARGRIAVIWLRPGMDEHQVLTEFVIALADMQIQSGCVAAQEGK